MLLGIAQCHRAALMAFCCALASASATAPLFAEGATRSLADHSDLGVAFTVTIALDPADAVAVGLEDSPPTGWTQIDNITNGGTYDAAAHKIKWGPFFAPFPAQVAYDLLPPGDVTETDCFVGTVSLNGINQPIGGDQCFLGSIPTLSQGALLVLAGLLLIAGSRAVRRGASCEGRSAAA